MTSSMLFTKGAGLALKRRLASLRDFASRHGFCADIGRNHAAMPLRPAARLRIVGVTIHRDDIDLPS